MEGTSDEARDPKVIVTVHKHRMLTDWWYVWRSLLFVANVLFLIAAGVLIYMKLISARIVKPRLTQVIQQTAALSLDS